MRCSQHIFLFLYSTINYSGSINAGGDSLIALYGWTTGPLVEYYVIETYGTYNPGSAGTHLGTVRHYTIPLEPCNYR